MSLSSVGEPVTELFRASEMFQNVSCNKAIEFENSLAILKK